MKCSRTLTATLRLITEVITKSVAQKQRNYERKIDKTVFCVVVEESDTATETAYTKIKRLIDNECEQVILGEKRKNQIRKATI